LRLATGSAAARKPSAFAVTARLDASNPGAPASRRPACGLTLRSAATPHGKPLGRRGALAYAAPRRPSALPRGSRLAQTLGHTQRASVVGAPEQARTPVAFMSMAILGATSAQITAQAGARTRSLPPKSESLQQAPGFALRAAGTAFSSNSHHVQSVLRLAAGQQTVLFARRAQRRRETPSAYAVPPRRRSGNSPWRLLRRVRRVA
jgi:hypothetical protein